MATVTEAYASRPVVTKRAANGTAVSSASGPKLVAEMLELLAVEPENRVLEIGAATGINAALLAELTGQTGHVTTIEIDDDLADGARRSLDRAGLGHPRGVVATVGTRRSHGGARPAARQRPDRVLSFVLVEPDRMVSTAAGVCGFVPIRGSARTTREPRPSRRGGRARDRPADEPDHGGIAHALDHPALRH